MLSMIRRQECRRSGVAASSRPGQAGRLPYFLNSASACLRATSDWPPSIRASSLTRSLPLRNRMFVIVRRSLVSFVTT